MRRRWLPSPLLSVCLALLWLMLNRSASLGHVLLAVLVGWLIPALVASLRPAAGRVARPLVAMRLAAVVVADLLGSALHVARGVLASSNQAPHSVFVRVPLDLRSEQGIAVLAIILTAVPGTVWSELAHDHASLLLHVWDLEGTESDFVEHVKRCYERPLMEIFE